MAMTDDLLSLFRAAKPLSDKPFIVSADGRVLTYGGLDALSARHANVLVELGVAPGDRVAVQVEKSAEAIALYIACLRAGAVYLPLNTAYTLAELDYFIGDAEPRLVVCAPERAKGVAELAARHGAAALTLGVDGLTGSLATRAATASAAFADVARGPGDLAAILYTSGTTGRSKGAMLTQRNLASNAVALRDAWRFTADDVLLHALPIFHTHGLFVASNVVLAAGATMIFLPRLDPDQVFRFLPQATAMM